MVLIRDHGDGVGYGIGMGVRVRMVCRRVGIHLADKLAASATSR